MLLHARCAGCDRPGTPLCRTCRFSLVAAVRRVESEQRAHGPDAVLAAMPFTGRARQVVLGLKYRNRRPLAHHLAGLLVNRLLAAGVRPRGAPAASRTETSWVDVVTWAPTSERRRRQRGFDQSELVARRVAAQLGVPCRRLLARGDSTSSQTGRGRVERLHGPSFLAHPRLDGERVLVIDDVVTTGATLRSAAATLRTAGAAEVVCAAIAATPSGVSGRRARRTGGAAVA